MRLLNQYSNTRRDLEAETAHYSGIVLDSNFGEVWLDMAEAALGLDTESLADDMAHKAEQYDPSLPQSYLFVGKLRMRQAAMKKRGKLSGKQLLDFQNRITRRRQWGTSTS